mgnify:CR=1 FL=1
MAIEPPQLRGSLGAPSKFLCFDPNSQLVNPSWASNYFFGTPDFSTVTTQTKIAYSPVTWLLDTSLSSRPYTPVMCLVHNLTQQTPCGQVVDSHDGIFGPIMMDAIYRYCLLNPPDSACAVTVLLDNSDIGVVIIQVVDWMAGAGRALAERRDNSRPYNRAEASAAAAR